MLRITQQSLAARTYDNLQASLARSARLQDQLSSGRQITRPSDAPGQTGSAMQLRSSLRTTEQYVRSSEDAYAWLTTADGALQATSTALRRARDLAVAGASSGAAPAAARQAMADEVRQIRDTVLGLANTTYLGRPVFAGTADTAAAYDASGAYLGDTGTVQRRIGPNAQIRADVDGVAAFGDGAGSVFDVLETLATRLESDPAALGGSIADLDTALDDVLSGLADVGARVNRVETMRQINEDAVVELRNTLSEVEDIDLPATIVELQLQEVAYQAALGATARVLQPSLLDFLR